VPQGSTVAIGSAISRISYVGGDGNDVTPTTISAAPPAITSQPANQSVGDGNPATFTASASSVPTPTVQWQVSNQRRGVVWRHPGVD
jgi:hypothetical protein